MNIDQNRYGKLVDWAETDEREIHPARDAIGCAAVESSRKLIRRAGGRPSVDPATGPESG